MKAPEGCVWIAEDVRDGVLMLKLISGWGESERQVSVLRVMPTPLLVGVVEAEAEEVLGEAVVVRITTGYGRERMEVRRERESGGRAGGGRAVV